MDRRQWMIALTLTLGACTPPVHEPLPPATSAEAGSPAVVRRPVPEAVIPPLATAPPSSPAMGMAVPSDALYVCVSDRGGQRRQTAIEFAPKVYELCRKHPEMGPCQYERDICRRSGGRVFAATGQEITLATEAEYDRKVLRVRFRAN